MAPVAVEPRKINEPEVTTEPSATVPSSDASVAEEKKKLPLIPILAAVVAVVVVGLLVKVLRAK